MVVAKPAGIHSVEQRGSDAPSVEAWLRAARPDLAEVPECGLVHRLDHETRGCLLVAKDADTRERLRDAFSGRGGEVRKTYLARVEGRLPERVMAGSFTLSFTSRHKGSAKVTVHT
ncbi:MAG: pseudouridine synthase, partial [bacterium]